MPNITPRKNKNGEITSYTIRVYHGYDSNGKRLKPYTMSYKPAPGMTPKQVEKEVQTNPADASRLTLPKVVAPKIEIFSKQEAAEMLSCLEKEDLQFQVLIQLAIMTGARCGELVGLKFSDIDFKQNKITIGRSAYKLPKQPIMTKPPKDYEVRSRQDKKRDYPQRRVP